MKGWGVDNLKRTADQDTKSSAVITNDSGTQPTAQVQPAAASKPRRLLLLASIAVAVLLLAGAGIWMLASKKENQASTAGKTDGSKSTTLVYAVHWIEDQQINGIKDKNGKVTSKGLNQYLDEYTALYPKVKFSVQQISYNEYADKLKVLDASGVAPDIYQVYSPWGASYVKDGLVAAPPANIVKDVKENYISSAGATIDGKIWGIPTEINNYALLYNKDLFKQAGIVDAAGNPKAPTTWTEVLEDAKKLTKTGSNGVISQYGFAFLRDFDWQGVDPLLSLLFSNGGKYLSDDLTKAEFNSPAGVAALDAELQLFKNKSTDANGNFFDFKDGKVGMVISPPWTKATFAAAYGDAFQKTVGVAPFPSMKTSAPLQYSWFTGVMKQSPNQDEAWKFLHWFTSDIQSSGTTRYGDLMANTIGAIPARTVDFNKHENVLGDFFTGVFVDQMKQSKAEPNVLQSSAIKSLLMKEVQAAWDGKKTSKEALDSAANSVNAILEQNNR